MKSIEFPTKFTDLSYHDKLRKTLSLIQTWNGPSGYFPRGDVSDFMDSLGHLYLDYFQYHIEEAQAIGFEFAQYIRWGMSLINEGYISANLSEFHRTEAWDSGWHKVCWVATTIEVFHLMFGWFYCRLRDDDFWEYVEGYRFNRFMIDDSDIPKNMPFSHSWWFREYDLEIPVWKWNMISIDQVTEEILGEEIKIALINMTETLEEKSTVRYLNSLINSLRDKFIKRSDYQVFLIEGPPNVYALPGSVICITKGLMHFIENEAELAALLAHEMGHIEYNHTSFAFREKMLNRKKRLAFIGSYVQETIQLFMNFKFGEGEEEQADVCAFQALERNGYDPMAIKTVLERLNERASSNQGPTAIFENFFASHPFTEQRIEKFDSILKWLEENYPDGKKRLGKQNFRERITVFEAELPEEEK